ncbi:MAG: helix-turn-helix transcriptional regulator [Desulfovibrio sp.]|jgi:phage repressor protein C with HTH and peptisase S24 domain|nr:helix-turn-helix transcriptional regulator [Desulfovibrio sp.]
MQETKITAKALRFWIKKKGLTQAALAERAGLAQNYISQIHTGTRPGSVDVLQKIAVALDLSLPEFFACRDDAQPDIVFIERLKARPRAGNGGLETDPDTAGYYSFHSSFIARKHGDETSMRLFEVAGDSMSPTLADGDMILVNLRDKDVRSGYIYLVRMEDELMVKRLENRPGGILLIRSDNPDYEDLSVRKNDEGADVEVLGRMVWSCREY